MSKLLTQITLEQWEDRYTAIHANGKEEPPYCGPLDRHYRDGDSVLKRLRFDPSAASLRLWNFLLTEETRLHEAFTRGEKIVGAMKDLGTIPVMAFSLDRVRAFYPDGAFWIPCIMELNTGLLSIADSMGVDESFCPVRAMLGAFVKKDRFPIPDLLTCSIGATCDDFAAIAQRLEDIGHPILWWEIPHRRHPDPGEEGVMLPGGFIAPVDLVGTVREELSRIRCALEDLTHEKLDDERLLAGIRAANRIRGCLAEVRRLSFTAERCPLPALELLIAEMLAIHFCSDRDECLKVLRKLLDEVRQRVSSGTGFFARDAVRVFWVNPVADIQVMNLLEQLGGRICGTEYLFSHALDEIPEDILPLEALARTALADPMVGSAFDRASRICRDARSFGAEAMIISRIPGASHCALEGAVISRVVNAELDIPLLEIEVPPVSESFRPGLSTRIQGLIEIAKERRI